MKGFLLKTSLFLMITLVVFTLALEVWSPFEKPDGRTYVNTKITYHNTMVRQLPEYIRVRYNNVGLIGEDFHDTIRRPRLIFVGWSNTQCLYIDEGKKWTDVALANKAIWYNNAAADGTLIPTWCKIIRALNDKQPDFVVALIDPFVGLKEKPRKQEQGLIALIKKVNVMEQIIWPYVHSMKEVKIGHKTIEWNKLPKENGVNPFVKMTLADSLLVRSQLDLLRLTIKSIGARPIFISAPTPYGDYVDKSVNMGEKEKSLQIDRQYDEFDRFLEAYCQESGSCYIRGYGLKKSLDYFYDYSHFTYNGSNAFGKYIEKPLWRCIRDNRSTPL